MTEQQIIDITAEMYSETCNYPFYWNPVFYIAILAICATLYEVHISNKKNGK